MGQRTGTETSDVGRFAEPPRDPLVRAFCDALADIVAVEITADLRRGQSAEQISEPEVRERPSARVIRLDDEKRR
jgi:hypothetical protein